MENNNSNKSDLNRIARALSWDVTCEMTLSPKGGKWWVQVGKGVKHPLPGAFDSATEADAIKDCLAWLKPLLTVVDEAAR